MEYPPSSKPQRIYLLKYHRNVVYLFDASSSIGWEFRGDRLPFSDGPNAREMHKYPLLPKSTMCFYCYYYSSSRFFFSFFITLAQWALDGTEMCLLIPRHAHRDYSNFKPWMELGTRKYIGRSFRWFDVSIQIQGMLPISFRIEVERNGLRRVLDMLGTI